MYNNILDSSLRESLSLSLSPSLSSAVSLKGVTIPRHMKKTEAKEERYTNQAVVITTIRLSMF